jgi:hypothetical protein
MATEIATRAGSHSRCTFDDERCQKSGRQVAERSDSGFPQILPKLVQMMPVPGDRTLHQSAFIAQILPEPRNLFFKWKWAAVTIMPYPATTGQPQELTCGAYPTSIACLRSEADVFASGPCGTNHSETKSSTRAKAEETSVQPLFRANSAKQKSCGIGEGQGGKNSGPLPSIPRSSQFESQASCRIRSMVEGLT